VDVQIKILWAAFIRVEVVAAFADSDVETVPSCEGLARARGNPLK
jgi:hypothetical protein